MNDQENFGGICYNSAGTSKITCPAQPTYSPAPTTSSCSQSLTNLLGAGCHWMYSDSSGRGIYCDGPMTKSAKEGDAATIAGCSGGGVTYTPSPSCPSGQWWDPAKQSCTSTATTCATGYYWDSATSTCKIGSCGNYVCDSGETSTSCPGDCGGGTTYTPYPTATSCGTGYYWDSAANMCKPNSTTSYTPPPSCPSGQWWDYTRNSCQSSTSTYSPYPTYTPYSGYCGDNVCSSSETSSSCPSDCGGGTIATPYSTPPTYTPPPTCSTGQYWDGSSCVTNPTPPPVESTYSPPPTSVIYQPYMIAHCQQLGRTWNGEICQANGLFVRFFEGSGMANVLRLFYIIP